MSEKGLFLAGIKPVVRNESLSARVYGQLRLALMSGEYKPGEKVTIRAIADAAQVSFTPAREAVGRLIVEGALENEGPKTVVVPVLNRHALEEVTAIRKSLEVTVTNVGAPKLGARQIAQLHKIQDRLEQSMGRGNFREVLKHNEEFHFLIYRRSGYLHAVQMIESCWVRIGPSLNLLYPEFSISRAGVSNHNALLAALEAGRPEDASGWIKSDIEAGFERLSELIA